jgi:hypothetical protein
MEPANSQQVLKQTFNLLKYTFVIVPIVAGADKFTNLLTNWEQYVNPAVIKLIPFPTSVFMMIVGTIEVAAGIIVLKKTEIGGYIVAAWLTVVALTLLIGLNYVDIAIRDLVMAITALSVARISKIVK